MNRSHIIEALRAADWSNTPNGNLALIQAAIEHLEAQPSSVMGRVPDAVVEPKSRYIHRNGVEYEVVMIANGESTNPKYPPTIVYRGVANGKVWARPACDWDRSMQLVERPAPAKAEGADQPAMADYEEALVDHRRLVHELDVLLNGEDGAAQQASLCDLVAQVRTLRLVHDENVPTDNLGQSLLMLEFALMFALCNFQHAGSRNDVKKAQTRLQEVLRFLSGKAKGFHLNTTELGYCAENPDVLRALAYEHDARAAEAEAIDLSGAVSTHETRAAVLRAEAKRIEDEL
ncbi:hypothetical protein [Pseudomonas aeruginosa]|uniref:hypothetical protein n=1 Tax=Pseudomonas aeruginosa TaxID=287 RepID=UPI00044A8852|nr:hypothetical protein [Pseudomonas aeruginosa]KAJ09081.1 hypothetical protein M003_18000 [Pseudomonas aeruginosa IGB83]